MFNVMSCLLSAPSSPRDCIARQQPEPLALHLMSENVSESSAKPAAGAPPDNSGSKPLAKGLQKPGNVAAYGASSQEAQAALEALGATPTHSCLALTYGRLGAWAVAEGLDAQELMSREAVRAAIVSAAQAPSTPGDHASTAIYIPGILNLSHNAELTALPDGLHVGQHLLLSGCAQLQQLPCGLRVEGNLDLALCTSLVRLAGDLLLGDSLWLLGCRALEALPDDLRVPGDLQLIGCSRLVKLPRQLVVGNSLYCEGCTRLRALPGELHVGDDLIVQDCKSLTRLPKNLHIEGAMWLLGCSAIVKLPQRLYVGGHLALSDCRNLTQLPEGLVVRGDLIVHGCHRLRGLPKAIQLGAGSVMLETLRDAQTRLGAVALSGLVFAEGTDTSLGRFDPSERYDAVRFVQALGARYALAPHTQALLDMLHRVAAPERSGLQTALWPLLNTHVHEESDVLLALINQLCDAPAALRLSLAEDMLLALQQALAMAADDAFNEADAF